MKIVLLALDAAVRERHFDVGFQQNIREKVYGSDCVLKSQTYKRMVIFCLEAQFNILLQSHKSNFMIVYFSL